MRYTKDVLIGPQFQIGEYTYGSPAIHTFDDQKTKLIIGRFCSIAKGVNIFLNGEHRHDWITTYPFNILFKEQAGHITGHPKSKGDVIIGNDAWIGYKAMILSGVKIGDGAVIGAGAVVSRDVAPYSIVAGNPARHIKFRFDQQQIEKLLKLKWWDWDIDKVLQNVDQLCSNNLSALNNEMD